MVMTLMLPTLVLAFFAALVTFAILRQ